MSSIDTLPPTNSRSALTIAWSCLAVIFACTWKAVHPDVPPPEISKCRWKMTRRRIWTTMWTLIMPELMVLWAVQQWVDVRKISDKEANRDTTLSGPTPQQYSTSDPESQEKKIQENCFKRLLSLLHLHPRDSNQALKWSRTHSYFFAMGGFSLELEKPPADTSQADTPSNAFQAESTASTLLKQSSIQIMDTLGPHDWPKVEKAQLSDRSKGDALSKALVIVQMSWFVSQLVARAIQGLVITQLEIISLAYAIMCGILYVAWFSKPYDVQQWIVVSDQYVVKEPDTAPSPTTTNQDNNSKQKTPQHQVARPATGCGLDPPASSDTDVEKTAGHQTSTTGPEDKNQKAHAGHFLISAILGGWIFTRHAQTINDPRFAPTYKEGSLTWPSLCWEAGLAAILSGALFGGINCIAWNFTFPTQIERALWDWSSVSVAASPLIWLLFSMIRRAHDPYKIPLSTLITKPALVTYIVLSPFLNYVYILTRIFLVVEAFVLLRDLSPSARQGVSWSSFYPHV